MNRPNNAGFRSHLLVSYPREPSRQTHAVPSTSSSHHNSQSTATTVKRERSPSDTEMGRNASKKPCLASNMAVELEDGEIPGEERQQQQQQQGEVARVSLPTSTSTQVAIMTIAPTIQSIPAHYADPVAYPVACCIPRHQDTSTSTITSTRASPPARFSAASSDLDLDLNSGAPTVDLALPELLGLIQRRDALTAEIKRQVLRAARVRDIADLQEEIVGLEAELARFKQLE